MMRLPRFALLLLLLLLAPAPFCRAAAGELRITSPDFTSGGAIPARFTCQGQDISPALIIAGVPSAARSLVLIVDDPDAPSGTFTHWLVWNIPPGTKALPAGASPPGALQGTNDFGSASYSGPCPPSGTHRYFFRLWALNAVLPLAAGSPRKDLEEAMRGRIIGSAALMGRYGKGG